MAPEIAFAETLGRPDKTQCRGEAWRPGAFAPPGRGVWTTVGAVVRRFLDLQAGSIWRDLSRVLPRIEGTIVDVGCGAQPYRELLGPRAHYVGLDTKDAMEHFGYGAADALVLDGERWPVADGAADAVLSTETLEHVPDPDLFLREALRVLRPGGTLIVTVPFSVRYHYVPHDYWRFTPSGLLRIFARAGFTDIVACARGNAVTVACYKVMSLILALVFCSARGPLRWVARLVALPFVPLLLLLALVGQLSLRGKGGDDCIGYTAAARSPS